MSKRSEIMLALQTLASRVPRFEADAIVDHAMSSRGLAVASPQAAAWLSMVAFVRHTLTAYDDLLEEGYGQESARYFVAGDIQAVLTEWGVKRPLTAAD